MKRLNHLGFAVLLTVPMLAEAVSGSWVRLQRFHTWDWVLYLGLGVVSLVFWAACLSLITGSPRRRWLALPIALFFGILVGAHKLFYMQYASVLTSGYIDFGFQYGWDVKRTLLEQRFAIAAWVGFPALAVLALLQFAEAPDRLHTVRKRWKAAAMGAGLLSLPLLPSNPAKPVDLQVESSLVRFAWQRLLRRSTPDLAGDGPYVPPVSGSRVNVLFILSESLRYDAYCNDPKGPCEVTPYVHRVMPERLSLDEMRSNDSFTIMSTAVVTTGLPILARRQELTKAPNVFELARAAGRHTEYLGSHKLKYLYLRTARIDHTVTFSDLSPDDDYDLADEDLGRLAFDRVMALGTQPFFVMLQFGDTHSPYSVDPKEAPFTPYERDFSEEGNPRLFNQYKNAIYRQDRILGQLIEKLRNAGRLDNTVVLFTSDHGEAFREHAMMYHGGSVLEEEIHVPSWIWVPAALQEQLGSGWANLQRNQGEPWTHLDLVPTMLDLMGMLGDPAIATFTQPMPGMSMLRERSTPAAIPIGNCSDLLPCAFRNYGMLKGGVKIEAREWDGYWNCWDVRTGGAPARALQMSEASCQELLVAAKTQYPTLPNGRSY